jgi:peptidoglycan/xylan/chitin deacetylase (PgdA/CDA1 family)
MTVVPLAGAIDSLTAGRVEDRLVCITFDDGYRDFLDHALPVLERLGFPATVYVPTAIIDGTSTYYWFEDPPAALSWEELRDLVSGGLIDVEPHSRTHPWLASLASDVAQNEIEGSKRDLEHRLGIRATSFCFPAGVAGQREVALVQAAGYRAAVTTDPGINTDASDVWWLRRTLLFWGDSDRIAASKLAGRFDRPSLVYRRTQRRRRSAQAPRYRTPPIRVR